MNELFSKLQSATTPFSLDSLTAEELLLVLRHKNSFLVKNLSELIASQVVSGVQDKELWMELELFVCADDARKSDMLTRLSIPKTATFHVLSTGRNYSFPTELKNHFLAPRIDVKTVDDRNFDEIKMMADEIGVLEIPVHTKLVENSLTCYEEVVEAQLPYINMNSFTSSLNGIAVTVRNVAMLSALVLLVNCGKNVTKTGPNDLTAPPSAPSAPTIITLPPVQTEVGQTTYVFKKFALATSLSMSENLELQFSDTLNFEGRRDFSEESQTPVMLLKLNGDVVAEYHWSHDNVFEKRNAYAKINVEAGDVLMLDGIPDDTNGMTAPPIKLKVQYKKTLN